MLLYIFFLMAVLGIESRWFDVLISFVDVVFTVFQLMGVSVLNSM